MRIGDAAAAAGTTPRALRFYEQRGLLPEPRRSPSGQREYEAADVARIRTVRDLLRLGLTVEDVRTFASRVDLLAGVDAPRCASAPDADSPASVAVTHRLAALDAEIARLTRLRDRLAQAAARA